MITVPNFQAGQVVTDQQLNALSQGIVTAASGGVSRVNTAPSIPNAAYTAVAFSTETIDDPPSGASPFHSTTSNTTRFAAPVGGYYLITAGVTIKTGGTSASNLILRLYVNGSASDVVALFPFPASSTYVSGSLQDVLLMKAGDYVELYVYQASGGTTGSDQFTNARVTMTLVGWM